MLPLLATPCVGPQAMRGHRADRQSVRDANGIASAIEAVGNSVNNSFAHTSQDNTCNTSQADRVSPFDLVPALTHGLDTLGQCPVARQLPI
jgi:hypothetical protein